MKELFRKLILIVVTVSMLSVGAIAQEIATPDEAVPEEISVEITGEKTESLQIETVEEQKADAQEPLEPSSNEVNKESVIEQQNGENDSKSTVENEEKGTVSETVQKNGNPESGFMEISTETLLDLSSMKLLKSAPAHVGKNDGSISGTISASGTLMVELERVVDHAKVGTSYPSSSGYFEFKDLAAGEYIVVVYIDGKKAFSYTETVGQETAKASAISATATGGINQVSASVTSASAQEIVVKLETLDGAVVDTKNIISGIGSVSFTAVPGTYNVRFGYTASGTGISDVLIGGVVVTKDLAGIVINNVVGGENKLTVTGTAEPSTKIVISTTPATIDTITEVGADGKFTKDITCSAGQYTAVSAQYEGNAASKITKTGTFTVTSSATKPILTIDKIDETDRIVAGKTTPGITVKLTTSDYAQTVTADANGIIRFNIPHSYVAGSQFVFTVYYGVSDSYDQKETVIPVSSYTLLQVGSTGPEVLALTTRLAELKYPISATNVYSETVAAAVRAFQQRNGITADGMAGFVTQKAIYSVSALPYSGASGYYPTLMRGNRGLELIYTLQARLKELGYYTIKVDGIYGSGTQRAVRRFQEVNGLTPSGIADNTTQVLLYSNAAKPAYSTVYPSSYSVLKRSNRYNAAVVTLQRRLNELGYAAGTIDGYFGSRTYQAIRSFQQRNGLSVTGIADAYTQQILYSSSAIPSNGKYTPSSTYPVTDYGFKLLYWGCKGDAVRRLQKALYNAGYTKVGTADGIYGQKTYDAVRAFQAANGLAVDGIAGRKTQNALYGTNY